MPGMHIRNNGDGTVTWPQDGYLRQLLKDENMTECEAVSTHMKEKISVEENQKTARIDSTLYLKLLGKLIYLLRTRPDICFAVAWHACRAQDSRQADYDGLI